MDNEDKLHEEEHCCPERFPSPQLPSPADCLPPDELAKLIEQIRDTNELLLDLALSDSRSSNETYRKVFDGLTGLRVEIANHKDEKVIGVVTLVGSDFLVLRENRHTTLVPFDKIDGIQPYGKYAEPYPESKIDGLKPSLQRKLTAHFGEAVASSPKLIQLFFGIPLDIYLRLLEDKRVKVTLEDMIIEGVISDANKESITVDVDGKRNVIPIEEVSLIAVNL
ncbi:hypothetical protein JSQ81_08475 [Sporosarcina sp. Marseille-Q4063]|uniref:hypothetical protein n=1 Tax=Sporosarcina sp. Marseille-Q4063 TaxID=2810514 RepID=UPI001BAE6C6B|nr:hypothetical protein [Sporosarcina sp. Marseille-Q4063]QUW23520.1 hypothetical protein JSQ81_08475 [Sporosarcina sp. Marseille-Q4063]